MTVPRRWVTSAAALLAGALGLAACSSGSASSPSQPSPSRPVAGAQPTPSTGDVLDLALPVSIQNLPLVDQDGRTVTLSSLHGRTVVVTPSLTLCQEFCPLISANIGSAQRAVAASGLGDKVTFLEVTVDPGRDDQAHLKAYQGLYGAAPNWDFMRGSTGQIAAFWNAFHLSYGKVANDPDNAHPHDWLTGAAMTYDVDHQNILYVLGTDGHIAWLTDAAPNVMSAALPDKLRRFLDADGIHNLSAPSSPSWTSRDLEEAIAFVTGAPVHPPAA